MEKLDYIRFGLHYDYNIRIHSHTHQRMWKCVRHQIESIFSFNSIIQLSVSESKITNLNKIKITNRYVEVGHAYYKIFNICMFDLLSNFELRPSCCTIGHSLHSHDMTIWSVVK